MSEHVPEAGWCGREWRMEAQPFNVEKPHELVGRIAARVRLLPDEQTVADGEWWYQDAELADMLCGYTLADVASVLEDRDSTRHDPDIVEVAARVANDMAWQYYDNDLCRPWWHRPLPGVDRLLPGDLMDRLPMEQLIIGHEGRAVRFYNYSDTPLTPAQRDECRDFIAVQTTWFGERFYDELTDVVIVPFEPEDTDRPCGGYTRADLPEVIFVNSDLLDMQPQPDERYGLQASWLSEALHHEFGHKWHGYSPAEKSLLYEFAAKAAVMDEPDPKEAFAKMTSYIMLGADLKVEYQDSMDAWLNHAAMRVGETMTGEPQPLAAPIEQPVITVEHRRASDAVYPKTPLPDVIYLKPVNRTDDEY